MHRGLFPACFVVAACLAPVINVANAQNPGIPDTLERRVIACAACHGKSAGGLKANE